MSSEGSPSVPEPKVTIKRVEAGRYETSDHKYVIRRWSQERFTGTAWRNPSGWITERGWVVEAHQEAKAPPLGELRHEVFDTKAEAVKALRDFRDYLSDAAQAISGLQHA